MLRRAVIPCLVALVLTGSSAAAPQELIPGLPYDRKVEFTTRGPPGGNGVSLFTPSYGQATPPTPGSFELTLASFPPARPNAEIAATVVSVSANGGGTPIPAGGAVLVARGTAATFMQKEAPPGQAVRIRLILKPAWSAIVDAVGAGRRWSGTAGRSSAPTSRSRRTSCCRARRAAPSASSPTGGSSSSRSTARARATARERPTSSSPWRWSSSER